VLRFRASSESVKLLRDVYRKSGREADTVDQLRRLHEQHPKDRALLLALANVLRDSNRQGEAGSLLQSAFDAAPADNEVTNKLFDLYRHQGDVDQAARVLVMHLAASPDSMAQMGEQWSDLIRSGGRSNGGA